MTRAYLELVGVQVTHSKAARRYRIENVYARRVGNAYKGFATMKGYDMTLSGRFDKVAQCMMDAYAPVIKSVWNQDNRRTESFYLQFVVSFRPDKVGLTGHWVHWAEW